MFPKGGQTRRNCFLAMFPEGGQTRKHSHVSWRWTNEDRCFLAMFPKGGQTRKEYFLATFPEGEQNIPVCFCVGPAFRGCNLNSEVQNLFLAKAAWPVSEVQWKDKCRIRRNIHGSWWILNTYQQKSPAVCNQITPSLYEEEQSFWIRANLYQFLTVLFVFQ